MTIPAALSVTAPYPTTAGYAFALILFFGRGRGRGGRATAKPTDSRRSSADGPDSQGVRVDRRNGDRTGIVFIGDMCYTWVSKQTNKLELVRTGVYDEHDNMA